MKIVNRLNKFMAREKIAKQSKYEEKQEINHLKKEKTKKEKLYDYYICDYCGDEIIISGKWEERTGGICKIPQTMSNADKTIYLALCNKCVIPVQKEFKYKQQTKCFPE